MRPDTSFQRRSNLPLLLGVFGFVAVVCAAEYYLLVARERQETARLASEAAHLEEEVARGRRWLAGRPDPKEAQTKIDASVAELSRRVPVGRNDILVAQFLEQRARALGLQSFRYEVVGGLAIPDERLAVGLAPTDRLALDPKKLQTVPVQFRFSSGYRDLLGFVRGVAEAPWAIEIAKLELRRDPKSLLVETTLTARYRFQ